MKTVFILAAVALAGTVLSAADSPAAAEGGHLFRIYCAGCHGTAARGDGPAANELETSPADLTLLARNSGGDFPREAMMRRISGIENSPGHQPAEMPLWGFALRVTGSDADQQAAVDEKIRQLVDYLETIQNRK